MSRAAWLFSCLSLVAAGSSVLHAAAQSTHFKRTAQTVSALKADGEPPDDKGWQTRTEAVLRGQVDHLEAALPRLRDGFPAARALVPLEDPAGHRRVIDLTGQGWALLEVAFIEEPPPLELDALRRAMAQELQVRPLEPRRRPVRFILAGLGGAALVGGLIAWIVRRRRQRLLRPR